MLTLRAPGADLFIPAGTAADTTLAQTTHLGVGAHQDDLEILAYHGILETFGRHDAAFTGVTCTDGRGSARQGLYAEYSDDDMVRVRREEQRAAATLGRYAAMLQLNYPSARAKDVNDPHLVDDLTDILRATHPRVLYTHNPVDKHATHIAVLQALLAALARLPPADRPEQIYGCEVWRDLDWMPDDRKVVLNVGGRDHLAAALLGTFDSQIAGGKRYDLAAIGRRRANATYFDSHAVDAVDAAILAIDLTPVVHQGLPLATLVAGLIDAFRTDALQALAKPRHP